MLIEQRLTNVFVVGRTGSGKVRAESSIVCRFH